MGTVNCIICGSEYEVCRACPTTTLNTPWRRICDTPVHYQVYMLIQDLRAGTVTKPEAKEMLIRLNVTKDKLDDFLPGVKAFLLPVFEEEEPVIVTKRKTKKTIAKEIEAEKVEQEIQPETEPHITTEIEE